MMHSKFLGDTKGNRDLKPNRTVCGGGSGESHAPGGNLGGKFAGGTKGNRDLKPDRTAGNSQGSYAGK